MRRFSGPSKIEHSSCFSYVDQYQELLSNSTQEAERSDLEKYIFTVEVGQGEITHFNLHPDDPPKFSAFLSAGTQSLEKGVLPPTYNYEKWLIGAVPQ